MGNHSFESFLFLRIDFSFLLWHFVQYLESDDEEDDKLELLLNEEEQEEELLERL